jgi:hypothetical protein
MVTLEITSKTENWYRHLETVEVVTPYADSVSAIYVSSVYVLTNNFLTVLFKGRCRRGGVTLRFNTMDSIIINLTYTQAPHSPLFPNPTAANQQQCNYE